MNLTDGKEVSRMIPILHDHGPWPVLATLILGGAFGVRLALLARLRRIRLRRHEELEAAFLRYDRTLSGSMADAPAP